MNGSGPVPVAGIRISPTHGKGASPAVSFVEHDHGYVRHHAIGELAVFHIFCFEPFGGERLREGDDFRPARHRREFSAHDATLAHRRNELRAMFTALVKNLEKLLAQRREEKRREEQRREYLLSAFADRAWITIFLVAKLQALL
jgi:hypothetical protein